MTQASAQRTTHNAQQKTDSPHCSLHTLAGSPKQCTSAASLRRASSELVQLEMAAPDSDQLQSVPQSQIFCAHFLMLTAYWPLPTSYCSADRKGTALLPVWPICLFLGPSFWASSKRPNCSLPLCPPPFLLAAVPDQSTKTEEARDALSELRNEPFLSTKRPAVGIPCGACELCAILRVSSQLEAALLVHFARPLCLSRSLARA